MSVLEKLASALGRNDEVPNIELAAELAKSGDTAAIATLAGGLLGRVTAVQNDAIKVLYEIGAVRPEFIRPHADAFFDALKSRNNRLVWGAMTALDTLAATAPDRIAGRLPEILDAADRGSVIAKDKAVSILATLAAQPRPVVAAWERLIAILHTSADNQTPMYAELALRAAPMNDAAALIEVIQLRMERMGQPAKRARLEKVLRSLAKPAKK